MSTNSRISLKTKENTYLSIYCHFDGYISGVGQMLVKHWSTLDKVKELFEGKYGAIRTITENLEDLNWYYEKVNVSIGWEFNDVDFNYMFDGECWWVQNDEIEMCKLTHEMIEMEYNRVVSRKMIEHEYNFIHGIDDVQVPAAKQLCIYKISQDINRDWGTYHSAVVIAANENDARLIHPACYDYLDFEPEYGKDNWWRIYAPDYDHIDDVGNINFMQNNWVIPEQVEIELIGVANEKQIEGTVICAWQSETG